MYTHAHYVHVCVCVFITCPCTCTCTSRAHIFMDECVRECAMCVYVYACACVTKQNNQSTKKQTTKKQTKK